jgi:hypothetical protein
MRTYRSSVWLVVALATLGLPPRALAQGTPVPNQTVLAESLFLEGKRLLRVGELAEACPKLAESQRLDPAPGTLLALALCHERQNKIASAWAEYKQALAMAQQRGQRDRERAASERIAALEPTLPRLLVLVPAASRVDGVEIRLDGVALAQAAWNTPLPVDPGEHEIEVVAPGHRPHRVALRLAINTPPHEISVPPLDPLPAAPAASSAPPVVTSAPPPAEPPPAPLSLPSSAPASGRFRPLVYGLGGGSALALGVAAALGGYAWSRSSDARDRCPTSRCDDPQALSSNRSADRAATGANVAFGVGLVSLGAAAVFWWLGREPASTSAAAPGSAVLRF